MLIAPAAETQCWLVDIVHATDVPLCGGKAAGLARLEQAGWAVPAAICVTTDFYRRGLAASGLAARMPAMLAGARDAASRRRILEEIRVRMEAAPLPDDLEVLLGDGIGRLQERPNGPLSVRSSGVDEDDHNASQGGIHSSLVVAGHDLPAIIAAIKTCWASPWTRSEEHTSELQSPFLISYAVFCLKKKKTTKPINRLFHHPKCTNHY